MERFHNGEIIYSYKNYRIKSFYNNKRGKNEYIVYNVNATFKENHTHVDNYFMCKKLIWCALHKTIDKKICRPYLLNSLIRLSEDNAFIEEIKQVLKTL